MNNETIVALEESIKLFRQLLQPHFVIFINCPKRPIFVFNLDHYDRSPFPIVVVKAAAFHTISQLQPNNSCHTCATECSGIGSAASKGIRPCLVQRKCTKNNVQPFLLSQLYEVSMSVRSQQDHSKYRSRSWGCEETILRIYEWDQKLSDELSIVSMLIVRSDRIQSSRSHCSEFPLPCTSYRPEIVKWTTNKSERLPIH